MFYEIIMMGSSNQKCRLPQITLQKITLNLVVNGLGCSHILSYTGALSTKPPCWALKSKFAEFLSV